jgi:nicotinamidase-related amidase
VGLGVVPGAFAAATIKPDAKSALLVIDVQNCFVTGGTLPVKDGEQVVPIINKLSAAFENVVVTQDWHTPGHVSFASAHAGKKPFETTKLAYGTQVLWPDHCVQGSADAALLKDLALPKAQLIIRKGYHQSTDSYSAFMEADGKTSTGLAAYLKAHGVDTVYVCGPGHRLLRRLDRARRAQGVGGIQGLRGIEDRERHRAASTLNGSLGMRRPGGEAAWVACDLALGQHMPATRGLHRRVHRHDDARCQSFES